MAVQHLTKENFNEVIIRAVKPVIVDFWAPWCNPCKMQAPILEEVSQEIGDEVILAKVNVEEEVELSSTYNILFIPTFIVFKNNQIVDKKMGFLNKEQLISLINKHK